MHQSDFHASPQKKLTELVERNPPSVKGIFASVHDDLIFLAKNNITDNNLIRMAYGYAIRMAGAALYLQGVIDKKTYKQISNSFKDLQISTEQDKEFQEEAADQAMQLILSYPHSLTAKTINSIVLYVEKNLAYSEECNKLISYEQLIADFNETKEIEGFPLNMLENTHHKPDFKPEKTKTLVELVERNIPSGYGAFLDVNNDLAYFIEQNPNCCNLIKMAYGYARRNVSAGMYLQGLIDRETYDYISLVFKGLQRATGQSKTFQIKANSQAQELIECYSDILCHETVTSIVLSVERGTGQLGTKEHVRTYESIVSEITHKEGKSPETLH